MNTAEAETKTKDSDTRNGDLGPFRVRGLEFAAWATAIVFGYLAYAEYEFQAAPTHSTANVWPAHSRVFRKPGKPVLVMFIHPRCPCSSASLAELQSLLTEIEPNTVTVSIQMTWPTGAMDDWDDTSLRREAMMIAGSNTVADPLGIETKRFGAISSGETFLYDGNGRLLFHGGLTGGRNNMAATTIRATIANLLNQTDPQPMEHPVFGCPLFDAQDDTTNSEAR